MAEDKNQATPLTEEQLKKREEALIAGEAKLKEGQEALKQEKKDFAESKKGVKPEKVVPGEKFEFQGVKKKFRDTAPKSIRYDGKVWSQAELIKDEDAMNDLVSSNSNLFENL